MRRLAIVALAALAAACSRDMSLPPAPGAGSIQGRVVYGVPGQSSYVAAAGARVTVLGTSIGATAGPDGRFVVSNAAVSDGSLLVQVDLDTDGTPDRQTLLSLAALGARPGRDLALGDVVVVENARIRGRVLRADVPTATTGHAGTVVFVPQGPFTTLTGDDGSYVFENLPEGRISVTFFRDSYDPGGIDGIQLGAGQDFLARDVTLAKCAPPAGGGGPQPGAISGQLTFSPGASGTGATVTATPLLVGTALSAPASASGAFQLASVPAGVYRVEAARAGYATAVVANVLVQPGVEVRLGISLAAQGVTVTAPDPGPAPTCVAGARCDLPNPCRVGQVTCVSGAPFCGDAGNALDGIPCGANHVCSGGACVQVCVGGASCRPASPDQCKDGVVSCTGGTPACVAGAATLADGTSCGQDQVCHAGACSPCVAGKVCTPANACHTGLTSCASGVETCDDTALALGDGTPCGSSLYCAAGACGACTPGVSCFPPGQPCHAGQTSCATGRAVCVDLGTALANGTGCGTNQVCFAGACGACTQGAPCTPQAVCHLGTVDCGTGQPICVDEQLNVPAGTTCGTDHVCDAGGGCVACVAGQGCTPTNACHAGGIACGTGAPVCGDLGISLANGTVCGADQVCFSGTCVGCVAGALCTPSNPCHYGETSCATGASVCGDTNVPLADGATCGADLVCRTGACVACATGAACDGAAGHAPAPGAPDPCKQYVTFCASGTPVCDGSQGQPDGTVCGPSLVCRSGSCQTSPLAIQVAGDLQHALPNQPLPQLLAVTIRNVLTATGVGGQTVYVTPPPGAQVNRTSATTDPTGVATFALTLGRAVGIQDFVVRHDPSYPSTIAATEFADQPPDATVIPLVNTSRTSASNPTTGPGPAVPTIGPTAVAAASNGDVYFSDGSRCQVRKLSPTGVVSVIGGTGCSTSAGDGGLATNAVIPTPQALALDEGNQVLYVGENQAGGNRVRVIDLRTGLISTFAGNGSTGSAPYGDGAPANQAQLYGVGALALAPGPNPALYIADLRHVMVRRIDPGSGLIDTVLAGGSSACSSSPVGLYDFGGGSNGYAGLAVDAQGRVFVAGTLCGTVSGGAWFYGVARVEPGGRLAVVAGSPTGGLGGGPATAAGFGVIRAIAFDHAADGGVPRQNLYVADGGKHAVVRIDGATGRVSMVGGTVGTAASTGDFGTAGAASFNVPTALAFASNGRDLLVAEQTGNVLRAITGAGSAQATRAALALAGGDAQTVYPDQTLPAPLSVVLTEGAGAPVSGFPVRFALDPSGNSGGSLAATTSTTTTGGVASTTARVGLKLGQTRFVASFDNLHGDPIPGSPVTFTATASAPPAGTTFTVVNDSHVASATPTGVPGPGTVARIDDTWGSALLPDGSVAFVTGTSGGGRVLRLAPDGTVSVLAGGGASSADGLPGPQTALNSPRDLALSPDGRSLYVGDAGYCRVRALDLASGIVTTIAGNGTCAVAPAGDGGLATSATLYYPGAISVAGGWLYVGTTGQNREGIRRVGVDPGSPTEFGNVFSYLLPGASTAGQSTGLATVASPTAPVTAWGCGSNDRCAIAVDPSGAIYVAGHFFGVGFEGGTGTASPGIARVDPATGALIRIAGRSTALNPSPGQAVERSAFSYVPAIAFDPAGNLWIAARSTTASANVVGWVAPDSGTGHVEPSGIFNQVGQTAAPAVPTPGSYAPLGSAFLGGPWSFTFGPDGHVFVTDVGAVLPSSSVRMIW